LRGSSIVNSTEPDLRSIHDFIAHDFRHYAKKLTQDIREKADILDQLPKLGKTVPEVKDDNVRELSLYSYRTIYEIKDRRVFVTAVVHKRKDFKVGDIER